MLDKTIDLDTLGFHMKLESLIFQICQVGRRRTFPEENTLTRERLIKEMILRRGCDIDAGNLPETLLKGIGKQSVEEREHPCKHLQEQSHVTSDGHQDRNSIDVHEEELQQHNRSITTVANNVLLNEDNFSTQDTCNSNTCPSSQVLSFTFQPRSSKEVMRNCTTLDRSLKDFIINTVARNLLDLPLTSDKLASSSHTASETVDKQVASSAAHASKWRKGGKIIVAVL